MIKIDGETKVWKFGYGSNLSPTFMREKKSLEVFDSKPAVLKGYKLIFPEAIEFVEPAFASVIESDEKDSEVHGTVSLLSLKSAQSLDKQEMGYDIKTLEVICYDGQKIKAEVYTDKHKDLVLGLPSKRYMDILIKGAIESNLKEYYVEMLKSQPYYTPTKNTLERRKLLPPFEKLKPISFSELSENNGKNNKEKWSSCLGYIFHCKKGFIFDSWVGRDVSIRNLYHYRGISLTNNDSVKEYPKISELKEDELEYIRQNLDRLLNIFGIQNLVGYLKEFAEHQK